MSEKKQGSSKASRLSNLSKNKKTVISISLAAIVVVSIVVAVVTLPGSPPPPDNEPVEHRFVSVWNTTLSGMSDSKSVRLPLESSGTYNFTADWGDDSSANITVWNQAETTHTYSTSGVYTIKISGTIVGWCFNDTGDSRKLLDVKNWGCLRVGNSGSYFYGCQTMKLTATDALNLTGTTTLYRMFMSCILLSGSGNINNWNVSGVTNMAAMFYEATSFNMPIGSWDVSGVTNMAAMFYEATSFNMPISSWDVSSVTNMGDMFSAGFYPTSAFNQPIGSWDVSSVTDMTAMFGWTTSFNQPLGSWDVSNVTTMHSMFRYATAFNQPLGSWNVSSVTNMYLTFSSASAFNQPLGSWNVSSVTNMNFMFSGITLSTPNYDNLLTGWSALSVQNGVTFHGGNSKYSAGAVTTARGHLTDPPAAGHGWTITDGGQVV